MGTEETTVWITNPELRRYPEYPRLVTALRLPGRP
jgi:hypothetical protein